MKLLKANNHDMLKNIGVVGGFHDFNCMLLLLRKRVSFITMTQDIGCQSCTISLKITLN